MALAFDLIWLTESFRILNLYSFVFDSDNSVVDTTADEMLNHISTKTSCVWVSRSVQHHFGQCVFKPSRAQRKASGSIILALTANT